MNARRAFRKFLRNLIGAGSDLDGAELMFGELAGNGAQHGTGSVTLTLGRDGDELTLSVEDAGGWKSDDPCASPPDPHQPRGRGLFFVRAMARRSRSDCCDGPATFVLPLTVANPRFF